MESYRSIERDKEMKRLAIIAAIWLAATGMYFAISRTPEYVADDIRGSLANCIAEQSYKNPELTLEDVVTICSTGR